MPVKNRFAELLPEITAWRRDIHENPELLFDTHRTSALVAEKLRAFGCDEVVEGIGRTGVVGIIKGKTDSKGRVIGLRADMDALPIKEATGLPYASKTPGKMHACGHDGHTTMLLGAAKYLAETRRFKGRVVLLFQPAEEDGGGGEVMVREGVMEHFNIGRVFGIHNAPNVAFGHFLTGPGPLMAAVDTATVRVTGRGGHAATPHETTDPVVALVAMVQAVQSIVTRNADARKPLVISVTQIHTGSASNIVPESGWFCATIRSLDADLREMVRRRFHEVVAGTAAAFGVEAEVDYDWGYPATVNHADQAAFAVDVAGEVAGEAGVTADSGPEMGAEDFSYMLEARPGAYLFLGTGPGAGLHHPAYDFNDQIAPVGASFFARLVERAQPVG
jgi:hippurate hydrolase